MNDANSEEAQSDLPEMPAELSESRDGPSDLPEPPAAAHEDDPGELEEMDGGSAELEPIPMTADEILRSRVFSIADKLKSMGVQPSNHNVREQLGRGSFSKISPLLREWKEQQASAEHIIVPPAISEMFQRTAQQVWTEAYSISQDENVLLRNEVDRLKAAMESETQAWEREVSTLGEDLRLSRRAHAETEQTLTEELQVKSTAVTTLEVELANCKADLAEATSEVELMESIEKSAEQAQAKAAAAREYADEMKASLESTRAELLTVQTENRTHLRHLEDAQKQQANLEATLGDARHRTAAAEKEIDSLKESVANLQYRLETSENQNHGLKQELESAKSQIAAFQQQKEQSLVEMAMLQGQYNLLAEQANAKEDGNAKK
tara:strand:+ start:20003 stop:21139 length:1137 start_codon:yes stop_codon:yes gene_type:complete